MVKVRFINNIYLLVDWANLAQQWIKMKETTPTIPSGQQGRSTTFEPNLLASNQSIDAQNTTNVVPLKNKLGDHNVVPIIGSEQVSIVQKLYYSYSIITVF